MKMACMIDSGLWISAFNKKDAHHEAGKSIISAISDGLVPNVFITDYIFNEVVTYIRKKIGYAASVQVADVLLDSNNIRIINVDDSTFISAIHIFQKYEQLSFTDASIVVIMKNSNLKWLYSFDSGFDGIKDIYRIDTLMDTGL
jgi:hypothetical protein